MTLSFLPRETEVVEMSETHVEQIVSLLEKYGLKEKDWEDLYIAIINLGIKDKAEITRELYNYLTTKYPHHVALGILAVIRAKHFNELFEKAKYAEGYHISATGIEVFQKLREQREHGGTAEPARIEEVEPEPGTIAYWLTGVGT